MVVAVAVVMVALIKETTAVTQVVPSSLATAARKVREVKGRATATTKSMLAMARFLPVVVAA